jgi:hypothetical protein
MTPFSRTSDTTPSKVEGIRADLRRQREDLLQQKNAGRDSSAETASILEKLEDLRRRSEAIANRDTEEDKKSGPAAEVSPNDRAAS